MSSPDVAEWIASVILAAAVPTTYFITALRKLDSRIKVLEYRMKRLNGTDTNGTKLRD